MKLFYKKRCPVKKNSFAHLHFRETIPLLRKWKLITRHLWDLRVCSLLLFRPSVPLISASMKFNLFYLKAEREKASDSHFPSESNGSAAGSDNNPQHQSAEAAGPSSETPEHYF